MRIVITVEEFDPEKGYLEYNLARELSKLGHKVYVFTYGWSKETIMKINCEGFVIIYLPYIISINSYHFPSPSGLFYINNFLRKERPHIVHCIPVFSPLSLIFISWSKLYGYKIVGDIMTQLNLIFSPWNIKQKLLFYISKIVVTKYIARKSAAFTAKTNELVKILSRSYNVPENKFRIVPLGTDPQLFKFNPVARVNIRKELSISEKDIIIVYSGKIDYTKGIDLLIKALSPLMNENGKIKLLIIGSAELIYVEYLKILISELGISKNVIFHQWVKKYELPDLYSASDIAVWPGLSSISAVDAASVGLPLILADVPIENFVVNNNNGFVFSLGNVNELRKYLRILVDNEDMRREMGYRSREFVERKLNWEAITLQYLNVYREVLNVK
ncbi:MAG: glycosyltransferase family 4 protein [Candidatus Bathyarchaeia archaeon]|jgi:glycosyltransferase involved in cell wall biosynthesis